MPWIAPLPEPAGDERTSQTWGRLTELFGSEPIPGPFASYARVPAFLQDFYMNFKKFVWSDGKLDARMKSIVGLSISTTLKSRPWVDFFSQRIVQQGGSEQTVADVIGVAASCAMYNVFFKFRDLAGSDLFSGMGVGLRAHTFANTSLDEKTVELINVAVSDVNGCKPCTTGHVDKARQLGVSNDALLETIQCAATMAAGIAFLGSD